MDEEVGRHDPKACPTCGRQGFCKDSRPADGYIRRRYRCRTESCGARWTTAEFYVPEGYHHRDAIGKRFLAEIGKDRIRPDIVSAIETLKALL